ncbi:MAG: hypothetical protein FWE80_03165 [Oscillospiraceae bacterium]|nr:hypothetical protein [Oscillospiraceae bacterium]
MKKLWLILSWGTYVWSALNTVLVGFGIAGVLSSEGFRAKDGVITWPLWLGLALLTAGMLWYYFFKDQPWVCFTLVCAGAVVLAAVGLHYMNLFPATVRPGGSFSGYTGMGKLTTRHLVSLLTALFIWLAIRVRRQEEHARELALVRAKLKENENEKTVFKDIPHW